MTYGDDALVTAASMQVRAEITTFADGSLKGILYNKHLRLPCMFVCLASMVMTMDELFNSKKFPEAFMSPRAFDSMKTCKNKLEMDGNTDMNDEQNLTNPLEQECTKCTFEISVKFRQHATWQGQILWTEKNLKQNFRSTLEMLLLMNEALTEDESPEPPKWERG